ncbi:MAG: DUF2703 domain-containing protein [Desulfobacteraceae bacterium]|nr:MAG: DUF2703 domain-containing protein [Desulfobacteraceae bacterium]
MKDFELGGRIPGGDCGCGCNSNETKDAGCGSPSIELSDFRKTRKILNVDLIVIDLSTCKRCVPTGDQLREAVRLMNPVAEALGIELRHKETVVQTPNEAKEQALVSSPTIRLNGRDIAQDIRESQCESCGDLTDNDTSVDCREWHYRGKVYSAAPIALLIEALMEAMLKIDQIPPVVPTPLKELPENLRRYFDNKKQTQNIGCCS